MTPPTNQLEILSIAERFEKSSDNHLLEKIPTLIILMAPIGKSISYLARRTSSNYSYLIKVISILVGIGIVRKEEIDHRSCRLVLTEKGEKVRESLMFLLRGEVW